jgi:hypothetical protein
MYTATRVRRLIVVDAENIAGGSIRDAEAVAWVKEALMERVGLTEGDHIVIGTSDGGWFTVGCHWPHVRYVARYGKDGADLALLDVLDEQVERRFAQVVVASGDHIFTDKVSTLVQAGVNVTVVGPRGGTSYLLAAAASEVLYVDGSYYSNERRDNKVAA